MKEQKPTRSQLQHIQEDDLCELMVIEYTVILYNSCLEGYINHLSPRIVSGKGVKNLFVLFLSLTKNHISSCQCFL
jgi:hypothetical protein